MKRDKEVQRTPSERSAADTTHGAIQQPAQPGTPHLRLHQARSPNKERSQANIERTPVSLDVPGLRQALVLAQPFDHADLRVRDALEAASHVTDWEARGRQSGGWGGGGAM